MESIKCSSCGLNKLSVEFKTINKYGENLCTICASKRENSQIPYQQTFTHVETQIVKTPQIKYETISKGKIFMVRMIDPNSLKDKKDRTPDVIDLVRSSFHKFLRELGKPVEDVIIIEKFVAPTHKIEISIIKGILSDQEFDDFVLKITKEKIYNFEIPASTIVRTFAFACGFDPHEVEIISDGGCRITVILPARADKDKISKAKNKIMNSFIGIHTKNT